MGPQAVRLLRQYWDRLTMVAHARGYYGAPFKCFHGVTRGGALSPNIFNVVVDAVLCNWDTVVAALEETIPPVAASIEGFRRYMQCLVAYSYVDYRLLV